MKNLFVTHKIEKDEKKESKLLIGKCKPEEKKDKLDLSLSPMNSESTKFSQSLKSNSHDMPIISRKETLNALSTDNSFSFDLKNASSFDDKNIKQKSFLGKKSKIHFNVIKENSENNIDLHCILCCINIRNIFFDRCHHCCICDQCLEKCFHKFNKKTKQNEYFCPICNNDTQKDDNSSYTETKKIYKIEIILNFNCLLKIMKKNKIS